MIQMIRVPALVNRMHFESVGMRIVAVWPLHFVFRAYRSVNGRLLCSIDVVLFITEP